MIVALLSALALSASPDAEDSVLQASDAAVAVRLEAELGTVLQWHHTLQIDTDGTNVRVPPDLGQDLLYPFARLQLDLDLGRSRRHTVALLYQPLDFQSVVAPAEDLVVGTETFPAGEALRFRYGFPFYRGTWLYDLKADNDVELAVGLGLQIRNANIVYTAVDGSRSVSSRNIGPVPLLAARARTPLKGRGWLAAELQGFYAPIAYVNGSDTDVIGAIADGSVKVGISAPRGAEGFLALRIIGGGAVGTSDNPDPYTGDGYTRNWIAFGSLSLGARLR